MEDAATACTGRVQAAILRACDGAGKRVRHRVRWMIFSSAVPAALYFAGLHSSALDFGDDRHMVRRYA
jgi:hypothetical protein